jgi:N-acetylglucosamine kinase-like BadF-type ATPase
MISRDLKITIFFKTVKSFSARALKIIRNYFYRTNFIPLHESALLTAMILIADSGSTGTTWSIIQNSQTESFMTAGINPFLQTEEEIAASLANEFSLARGPFDAVHFYGAGCANPEKNEKVKRQLSSFFNAKAFFVDSDLMAAARSLCGTSPGIASILGTGSNSCYFDGREIIKHVSPLGYILGDEGSGSVLGRKLLSDILKNQLPEKIIAAFFSEYRLQPAEILEQVYRKPFPNRFMAKFTPFLAKNIDQPEIYQLVKRSFSEFFIRNISQYPEASHMPVNFTGSIAWYFRDVLNEAAGEKGYKTGIITRSPMEGLMAYHISQSQQ